MANQHLKRDATWVRSTAQRAVHALHERGIQSGDVVCIIAPNSPELLAVVYGCLHAGIAPAVLSSSATQRELTEMSSDIQSRVVLRESDIHELVQGSALAELSETLQCRPIHFTSGTSGRPKAVWSGWLPVEYAQAWIDEEIDAWDMSPDDVHLVCGPLSHSAPLRFALMTILAGGSVMIPPKFTAESTVQALDEGHVSSTFMAPTHLKRIMDLDVPVSHHLRLLAHAGAACPDTVRRWAHNTFGLDIIVEFYGSTEGQFTICPAPEWATHPGTVGRARQGRSLRVDQEGRLWCQTPPHARFEYWGDPEKTKQTWEGDEWFTVGDHGFIDEEGYVYLQGRMGDLMITGGVNVYPAEIERVLMDLPGVEHVVAFGLPDEQWGQRVCVAVVGSVSDSELTDHITENLSGPKRPKQIFRMDSLPLTHSGKVLRTAVPALFASEENAARPPA